MGCEEKANSSYPKRFQIYLSRKYKLIKLFYDKGKTIKFLK